MPKPDDVGVGVSVVAIDPYNHLNEVLMGVRKGSHRAGRLALPGGWIDRSDTSLEAVALRELFEETGLQGTLVNRETTLSPTTKYVVSTEDHEEFRSVTICVMILVDCPQPTLTGKEPHKCELWQWVSENVLTELSVNDPDYLFPNAYQNIRRLMDW